jgi:hypothetical protein
MIRYQVLRTLLYKEGLSHLANRGGIALALLLVVAALLVALFGNNHSQPGNLAGGVQRCFVDHWEDNSWIQHLKSHIPGHLQNQIIFRSVPALGDFQVSLVYPPGTGAIQIRPNGNDETGPRYNIWFWQSSPDGAGLAPFEAWFWKETQDFFIRDLGVNLGRIFPQAEKSLQLPQFEEARSTLQGGLDTRSLIVTALVLFSIFFVCVYLLSSLTCEERERGVLLAQALSPASLGEILLAKFLFYPLTAMGLAALLTGILVPGILGRALFWLILAVASLGSLGIGLTIASLARTQRAASMGALCYMMAVTMLLFLCQQTGIPGISNLALEYHCPRILQAVVANAVVWYHWLHLGGAMIIAMAWGTSAIILFRRYGWQ